MNEYFDKIEKIKKTVEEYRKLYLLNQSDVDLHKGIKYPFSELLNLSKDSDLIDFLYKNFKNQKLGIGFRKSNTNYFYNSFSDKNIENFNTYSFLENSIIHENREEGKLVYISNLKMESFSHHIDLDNLSISYFTDYIDDYIDEKIDKEIKNILKQIQNVKFPKDYMEQVVNNVCNILYNLDNSKKNAKKYDIKNYNLIIEKFTLALKNIVYSYFEYLNSHTKNKVKSINPNFISFFEVKRPETSFEISLSNRDSKLTKLSNMRQNLIDNNCIKEISNSTFVKIFDNTYDIAQRIDWVENKGLLFYFINKLIEKGIIINPKNKWKKVSMCFSLNGIYIDYIVMKHIKASKNKVKNKIIDEAIKKLI